MPSFLDARDLRLLIGAGVVMLLLLGLTYAVSPPPAQQSLGYPSSYSGDWAGAKAAFLLLQNLGYSVERWEQSPEDLPIDSKGMVLVLAEPFQGATAVERSAVRRFVSGGGRVVAMGASAAKIVPDAGATEVPDWNLQPKTYSALVPSPQTHGAPEITMIAPDQAQRFTRRARAIFREQFRFFQARDGGPIGGVNRRSVVATRGGLAGFAEPRRRVPAGC